MSIIKGLFLGLKNQKVIPFNQMTPELHNQISSGLAKIMMAAKMTKAKLTKSQRDYITNQAKQVQEFEDRYITGIKDKAGNIIKEGKEKIGELFDLKGRKMDPTKSIIGGEQAGIMGIEKTSPKFIEFAIRNIKEMKNPKSIKDEINFIIKREGMYKNLTSDDAKQILDAIDPIIKKADGGRIGYKDGPKLSDFIDIQAEGSKSGEQQIPGAPPGITMDTQTYNFIVNAELPASEKINILLEYGRNKIRDKIGKDGEELFVGESGVRNRGIGFNFNPEDAGFGGEVMFNPDTNDARGVLTYKFNEGGRAAFKDGPLKRGIKAITDTDIYKTLEDRGFNTAVTLNYAFDEIFNLLSGIPFADGGRAAFKDGPKDPRRRTFMKAAAGLASLLPFGLGKVGKVAAPVVAKAAEISGPALAKIVETVMSLGKTLSMKGRKLKELTTKKKYKDIEVEEDMLDGPSYTIKKGNKEIYYKPGKMDETGGVEDDIIEIIEKATKKAGGGLAKMLGE